MRARNLNANERSLFTYTLRPDERADRYALAPSHDGIVLIAGDLSMSRASPVASSATSSRARPTASPEEPAGKPDPRRRVLDAASACFVRSGFHGTSMQEICTQAGMSPGGLYRHFPSKEAIIIAIVEEERSVRAGLVEALQNASSFVEGLERMGEALFSGAVPLMCLELGPEVYAEASRNPVLRPIFNAVEAEMSEALRGALVAAQQRGEIDPDLDPDIALLAINALGDGLIIRSRLEPDLPLARLMPEFSVLMRRMLAPPINAAPAGTRP